MTCYTTEHIMLMEISPDRWLLKITEEGNNLLGGILYIDTDGGQKKKGEVIATVEGAKYVTDIHAPFDCNIIQLPNYFNVIPFVGILAGTPKENGLLTKETETYI